jgi:hypothetical protein
MVPVAFTGIIAVSMVVLAVRGFLQVYHPTIKDGRIRVTSVVGREFWVPLWWRPFTIVSTVCLGTAALAYIAVLFFRH